MDSPSTITDRDEIVVLFDGVCNLCNGAVQFIIRRDPSAKIKFASLQSDYGRRQLKHYGFGEASLHSMIVICGGQAFEKSDAVLEIVARLGLPWRLALVLRIVPRFMRNAMYDAIARSRYKLFGRTDSCMIPDPSLAARFLS